MRLSRVVPAQAQQQLGTHPGRVEPVLVPIGEAFQTQQGGLVVLAHLHGLEDVAEHPLASACLGQSFAQGGGVVGFEQVAVQCRLGRLRHLGVGGFAGHHDEHGGVGQQVVAAQLIEQALAVHAPIVEMLLARSVQLLALGECLSPAFLRTRPAP
jgi:hypothetical protein